MGDAQYDKANAKWLKELEDWEARKRELLKRAERHGCGSSIQHLLKTNQVEKAEELLSGLD